MTDKKHELVPNTEPETGTDPPTNGLTPEQIKQIEQDEKDLKAIMLDQPGVAASAVASGAVVVGIGRPPKDEFFRCHPGDTFHPLVPIVAHANKMDKVFCTVTPEMLPVLKSLKISPAAYRIYLIQTEADIWRLVPVRQARKDGSQNVWDATLEFVLSARWWNGLGFTTIPIDRTTKAAGKSFRPHPSASPTRYGRRSQWQR
jgi:hypothetical protein